MIRKLSLVAGCALLFAFAAVACGGDDDNGGGDGQPTPAETFPTDVTPFATPLIEGNNVVSEAKGYSATFPDGWKPRINFIQTVDGSVDAYFEPQNPTLKVQASIALTCAVVQPTDEQKRIELMKTTTARLGLNENILVADNVPLAGRNVTALSYVNVSQQNPNQPRLAKTDYLFSTDKCDYTLTTTTAEGDEAKYKPQFDAFLASFKLLP